MNTTPVAIGALIVAGVAFVGAIIAYLRDRSKYRNHGEYAEDARALAREYGGDIFRDGDDLVLNGSVDNLPVVIRFSYSEGTPGLNIRLNVPANFQMSITPKNARANEGRVEVRSGDRALDGLFTIRSNYPTQAKMFIGRSTVTAELSKLCCSTNTFFAITNGLAELSELVVPMNTRRHVSDHVRSLQKLSKELRQMPFADQVRITPLKRERRWVLKFSLAVGIVASLTAVVSAAFQPKDLPVPDIESGPKVPDGVQPADAMLMGQLSQWRLANERDFDGDAVGWLRANRVQESGRLPGDFSGRGNDTDVAYVLVNKSGERRLVLLADRKSHLDVKYKFIGVLACIPKADIAKIEWSSRKPEPPDGDAVLITRNPNDRSSGLVYYLSDGKLVSGTPVDYQAIDLKP